MATGIQMARSRLMLRAVPLLVIAAGLVFTVAWNRESVRVDERPEIADDLPDALEGVAERFFTIPGSPPEIAFGLVGDVAVTREGQALVLDVLERRVNVFSPSGERTAMLGRPGYGPGEFIAPVALAVDEAAGRLFVLDERRGGIDVFALGRGEWLRTIPLDLRVYDLCVLSGRLYVLGARDGFLLHEIQPDDGTVVRSFAPDAESRNGLLHSYRASGFLGCAPSGEIAFLPSLRGQVDRFSAATGEPLGSSAIPDYRGVRVRPTDDGGMRFDVPGGGSHDTGSSVTPLPGRGWLVQVGQLRRGSPSLHEFESIRSYLLPVSGGDMTPLPLRYPRVMAARDSIVYSVQTSPYPAVRAVAPPFKERL